MSLVPTKYHKEFKIFIDGDEVSVRFLYALKVNKSIRDACEMALRSDVVTQKIIQYFDRMKKS